LETSASFKIPPFCVCQPSPVDTYLWSRFCCTEALTGHSSTAMDRLQHSWRTTQKWDV